MVNTKKNERRPLLEAQQQNDETDLPSRGKEPTKSSPSKSPSLESNFSEASRATTETYEPVKPQAIKLTITDPDECYNPAEYRNLENPTTNFDTMIHLLKGNIGTGVLAMPNAFRNAGLFVGLIGTMFMGLICTHCMHILVKSARELCQRCKVPALGFSEVVLLAFETGPQPLRKLSAKAKVSVDAFLVLTQIGFCCVYFLFVAINLQEVVSHYYKDISVHVFLALLLIPLILINWLKTLKYLTPVSFFATILMVCGLVITFWYILKDLPSNSHVEYGATWSKLPLFFGTVIYAFEGIGIVLPLENNMATPEAFSGWNGVLNTGMTIVTCLYTSVGFFGYLKYGNAVEVGSITLNLPSQEGLAQMVRLMMALSIFLSYCLQFYVPMNIIWPPIKSRLTTEQSQRLGEYIARTALVVFTFTLAAMIPNLGAVISLVGAFSSSALALIFPPLIEIITFWPVGFGENRWILWKDVALVIFGFFGFVIGTYVSVLDILETNYN